LTVKKTGTIEALNVSPKGFYEWLLLRAGKKIVQKVNGIEIQRHKAKKHAARHREV